MKKDKWIVAAALLLTACQTNASGPFAWAADGAVTSAGGKKLQLDIQGVYDDLSHAGSNYLAGFKIDKEGNNYPHIVRFGDDLSSVKYWPFDRIPSDIFVFQLNPHVVTTDGKVYRLENDSWQATNLTFPPDSHVVYSDSSSNAIICYPAALAKTATRASGCKSLSNKWQLDFVWQTQVPKVCDGKLYILEQANSSNQLKKIDIATGKEISSATVNQAPDALCKL